MKDEELKLEEIEVSYTIRLSSYGLFTIFQRDMFPVYYSENNKICWKEYFAPDAQRKQKQSKLDGGMGKKKKMRQQISFYQA